MSTTIAFNAADPDNQRKLDLLEKKKLPPSNLVVIDVRRDAVDGNQLLVELDEIPQGAGAPLGAPRGLLPRGVPAGPELRILCVHGVGHHEGDPANEDAWRGAIENALDAAGGTVVPVVEFVAYDELFSASPLGPAEIAAAMWKLGSSGVVHGIEDLLIGRARGDFHSALRWTAGMVVEWVEDENLRVQTRKAVADHVRRFKPDLILAHSLGSLICYDTFLRRETARLLDGRVFATFGSQIGNAFVRSSVALNGRIESLPVARHWFHLFNPFDDAFTARLRLDSQNFTQFETDFDVPGMLDHDAARYIAHPRAVNVLWKTMAGTSPDQVLRSPRGKGRGKAAPPGSVTADGAIHTFNVRAPKPGKRALLVGINDYPDPTMRLDGCVNDAYLVSEVLQELRFDAADIRMLLNERATAAAILDRLDWLLDGCSAGQERIFYFSGHGAQLPGYGADETIDRCDETLVPWDFDWSRNHAIIDNQFRDFYSQLPYESRFLTVLDCCHSGGMARDGGMRVRGISPPDDIRHRVLKWTGKSWQPRFEKIIESDARAGSKAAMGRDAFLKKLGRGAGLRAEAGKEFKRACRRLGHKGPYMPVILEACHESEFAYEYRSGATSHGAFTWTLAQTIREGVAKNASWEDLIQSVGTGLSAIGYPQRPMLDGPSQVLAEPISWLR